MASARPCRVILDPMIVWQVRLVRLVASRLTCCLPEQVPSGGELFPCEARLPNSMICHASSGRRVDCAGLELLLTASASTDGSAVRLASLALTPAGERET